jgi:hypothetical protein
VRFTVGGAGIVPRFAYLVERLGGRRFDNVVFSFEDERGGIPDVSMEVTIRVRLPFDEKVQAAGLWFCA